VGARPLRYSERSASVRAQPAATEPCATPCEAPSGARTSADGVAPPTEGRAPTWYVLTRRHLGRYQPSTAGRRGGAKRGTGSTARACPPDPATRHGLRPAAPARPSAAAGGGPGARGAGAAGRPTLVRRSSPHDHPASSPRPPGPQPGLRRAARLGGRPPSRGAALDDADAGTEHLTTEMADAVVRQVLDAARITVTPAPPAPRRAPPA